MKSKTYRLFLSIFLLTQIGLPACKNKDLDVDSFEIERESVVTTADSVSITGSYSFAGTVKRMKVNIGKNESLIDANAYEMQMEGTDFSVSVGGLKPSTEYYYRYSIDFGTNDAHLTETKSFTTLDAVVETPTVKTLEVLAIDSTTFRIKCEVVSDGGQEVTERGICFNTYGDPTMDDEIMQHANGGLGIYTIRMENLALGRKYYVRAYAKNAANKIGLSEEALDFETGAPSGMPVEIELGCNPEEGGSVTGSGTYEVGTQCTVTAEANTGYTFVNWTENDAQVSSEASYTFPVTVSRSLVANFTMQAYVITAEVTPENSGTITGAGGFNYGETCTLTATPNSGYEFVKWTKGGTTVSSDAEYTFTVSESATYKAHFKVKSYTISVSASPNNGGSVNGGGTFNHGHSCTVHATPANGFAFTNWTDEGDVVSEEADYTFPVTSNRTLVAHFTLLQPDEYSIIVSANPSNGGTVTGGGTYQQGQNCTVTATPANGYTFLRWTENGNQVSTNASYTFTVTANRHLVANFQTHSYAINVSVEPSPGGTVSGAGTYSHGQTCVLTATANSGYAFMKWTKNGTEVSINNTYSFTVTESATYVAHFQRQTYIISVSASPSNGGTVTGGGQYYYGDPCTLRANAYAGYTFDHWQDNNTTNPRTIMVTGSATYTAYFEAQPQVPQGAIDGLFSVSATQQVWFSQGNLQYKASTNTWRFAEHQWDCLRLENENVSPSYDGWIDLFGWGTSGYDHGAICHQPWSTSGNNSDYYAYRSFEYNLYDQTGQADWGYNAISNGGYTQNQWRTLTSDEWSYLFFNRDTPSGIRFAKAIVSDVEGLVVLPDNWNSSYYDLNETDNVDVNYSTNIISENEWISAMRPHGVLFLPAGSVRRGTSVENSYIPFKGYYWASSYHNEERSGYVEFNNDQLFVGNRWRNHGLSVRLVRYVP